MKIPQTGERVCFNHQGWLYPAEILAPWNGDAEAYAAKFNRSVDDVIAEHGMRATVRVKNSFIVKNAEYDVDGKRDGTWSYFPLDTTGCHTPPANAGGSGTGSEGVNQNDPPTV